MKSNQPPYVGMFHAPTKQLVLAKDATEIIAFHELAHLKHFEEVGELYFSLNRLEKEMYVWKQILANIRSWTEAELEDSLRYINDIRTNPKYKFNIEPIKL